MSKKRKAAVVVTVKTTTVVHFDKAMLEQIVFEKALTHVPAGEYTSAIAFMINPYSGADGEVTGAVVTLESKPQEQAR